MDGELNLLEKAILNEIAKFNDEEYPFIKKHIPYLKVKSRENTGVGTYVSFEYLAKEEPLTSSVEEHILLSSGKFLQIDGLRYGLNHALNITKGKIDFLELVTNGEDWDGNYGDFKFSNF